MPKTNMKFGLLWFSTDNEELVGEEELPEVTAQNVSEWFFLPEGDTLMDSYSVRASQRQHLVKYAKNEIDLNQFDYFLECLDLISQATAS